MALIFAAGSLNAYDRDSEGMEGAASAAGLCPNWQCADNREKSRNDSETAARESKRWCYPNIAWIAETTYGLPRAVKWPLAASSTGILRNDIPSARNCLARATVSGLISR